MFTGIVKAIGKLKKDNNQLSIEILDNYFDINIGDSIAVDGICLTAKTKSIHRAITTIHITNSIATIIKPPEPESWEITSWVNDKGKDAIIPTVINKEIPLPIPLSVIFSPNHIAKIQPVTRIITDGIIKNGPLPKTNAASGTPKAPSP